MLVTNFCLPILLVCILFIKISSESDEFQGEFQCKEAYEEQLEKFINHDIDPCEDFYTFMCSKWKTRYPIPTYYDGVWNYNFQRKYITEFKVLTNLRGVSSTKERQFNYHDKLFNYYNSCMEYGMTNDSDIRIIKLRNILHLIGGYPTLGIPLKQNYSWQNAIALLTRELDFSEVLMKLDVQKHLKNHKQNMIIVEPGSLGVEREILLFCDTNGTTGCIAYKRKIRDHLIRLNGGFDKIHEFDVIVDNIVAFEIELANISSASEDDSISYEVLSIWDFNRIWSYKANIARVAWAVYFTKYYLSYDWSKVDIYSKNMRNLTGLLAKIKKSNIDDHTDVAVIHPTYLKRLFRLLTKTNYHKIAHYIGWRVIQEFSEAVNLFYPNDPKNPITVVSTLQRQAHCIKSTERNFDHALARYYFEMYGFRKKMDYEIISMLKVVKSVYIELIQRNDWMDNATKESALYKLMKMRIATFGSLRIFYEDLIDDYYYKENPNGEYFETYLSMRRRKAYEKLELIKKIADYRTPWLKYATQFVGTYDRTRNQIYLPVGAISSPLYASYLYSWMKFAHIGTIIAREVFHAIDKIGGRFARNGTLEKWWTPETEKEYDDAVQCFVQQYARYNDPMTTLPLNANKTLEENVADNVGLHASYMAFKRYRSTGYQNCDSRPFAINTNYTSDQLFFMTYALSMCGYHKIDDSFKYYQKSRYSPAMYRIIGTLSNSIEFQRTFGCKPSSQMYVDEHDFCSIW